MAIIYDWGMDEQGVHTWRINGSKAELEMLLFELEQEKANFCIPPEIEHTRNRGYTVLLKLQFAKEGVGYGISKEDSNSHDERTVESLH